MTQVVTAAELAERNSSPDPNVSAAHAVFESDQPTKPAPGLLTGKVDGEPGDKSAQDDRPKSTLERVKAELAAKAAAETGAPTKKADEPAAKPSEPSAISADEIAKAEAKAKELAEAKAAIATAEPAPADKFKLAEEQFKTDPLKAMETLGWDVGDIVKKALGQKPSDKPTKEQELAAEVERLNGEIKASAAKVQAAEQARAFQESRSKTVQAILADPAFNALKTADRVEEAFKEARVVAETITKERGRPLSDTEGDQLVKHYLAKHNAKLAAETKTSIRGTEQSLKSGAVKPPVGRRSLAAVKRELAELAAQGK